MEACEGKFGRLIGFGGYVLTASPQNLAFAKDEAKFSMKKLKHKMTGDLGGREPDVETEV